MTPEGTLRNKTHRFLSSVKDLWFLKIHGSPFQRRGVPDYAVVYRDEFYGIELKVGTNELTKIQEREKHKILDAGGYYFTCRTLDDVKLALEPDHRDWPVGWL